MMIPNTFGNRCSDVNVSPERMREIFVKTEKNSYLPTERLDMDLMVTYNGTKGMERYSLPHHSRRRDTDLWCPKFDRILMS
jgi:hypothetical protein